MVRKAKSGPVNSHLGIISLIYTGNLKFLYFSPFSGGQNPKKWLKSLFLRFLTSKIGKKVIFFKILSIQMKDLYLKCCHRRIYTVLAILGVSVHILKVKFFHFWVIFPLKRKILYENGLRVIGHGTRTAWS